MKEDLYIDVVSRTIISRLSESIGQYVLEALTETQKNLLLKDLPAIILDELGPVISKVRKDVLKGAEDSEEKILGLLNDMKGEFQKSATEQKGFLQETLQEDLKELKTDLSSSMTGFRKNAEESQDRLGKELLDLRELLEENARKQSNALSDLLEGDLKKISAGVKSGLNEMMQELTDLKNSAGSAQEQTLQSLKTLVEENIAAQLKTVEESGEKVGKELKALRQQTEESAKKQGSMLSNALEGDLKIIRSEISAGLDDLQKGIAGLKESTGGAQEQTLQSLKGFIEKNIAGSLRVSEEMDDELKREMNSLRDQVNASTQEQSGLLTNIFYATKKMTKAQAAPDENLLKKIEESLASGLQDLAGRLQEDTAEQDKLAAELKKISGLLKEDKRESGIADMLNSIFYSIKKLTTAYKQEQDLSLKFETKFMGALEVLYGHILRLEEEKEDVFAEMIRVAGTDYMKSKLDEYEKEVKKANDLAEKYKREKQEVEERLVQMQSLLEGGSS